ncbi:ribosomal protein L7/L12 [Rhizobium ruizarguesonis]
MGSFEKGQWVRVIDNGGAPRLYSVGEVCQVETIDGTVTCVGKNAGMYSWRFEAWQPKVGDRVRFTDAVPSHWFFGPTKEHKEGVIRSDSEDSEGLRFTVNVGNSYGYAGIRHIEPVPAIAAPAPLTITAGKFYKTRDGRKVGPLRTWPDLDGNPYPDRLCEAHGDGRYWMLDGKGVCADDLIAEWVDEPATAIANDNAAPAKFNVGDRVCGKNCIGDEVDSIICRVDASDDGMPYLLDEGAWCRGEDLELVTAQATTPAIVALIESGVAKPALEPKVHASEADATVEAERLAGMYRGQRFGIFVLSDTREADIPTYDHEWKNFAARGEKIRAIKELRSITGMGLKPAKDAVEYFLAAA